MQVGWYLGINAQGVRGSLASRNYQPGDVITIVPRNCTIDLGPQEWTAPVSFLLHHHHAGAHLMLSLTTLAPP